MLCPFAALVLIFQRSESRDSGGGGGEISLEMKEENGEESGVESGWSG